MLPRDYRQSLFYLSKLLPNCVYHWDADHRFDDGVTFMHIAAAFGTEADLLRLTMKGLDINASDVGGRTPLHLAAWMGNTRVIQPMLAGGADPYAEDAGGRTPLHYAARYGCRSAVYHLAHVMDRPVLDHQNRCPLHNSMFNAFPDVAVHIAQRLGCNLNQVDKEGSSLLVAQAMGGHYHVVVALAAIGADPDFRDPLGHTAAEVMTMSGAREAREEARTAFREFTAAATARHLEDQEAAWWGERERARDW